MRRYWNDIFWRTDWVLLGSLLALTAIGLLMIYGINTSAENQSLLQFNKQILAVILGMAALSGLAFVDYRQVKSLGTVIYVGGFLLLIAVLVFGSTVRGTQGWFQLGTLSFQPVEIAKVAFAVFLASYFSKHVHQRLTWISFFGSMFAMLGYVVPILLQPDFGSAMVVVAMWFIGVAFGGLRARTWILVLIVVVCGSFALWHWGLKPYQQARLTAFMNPQADPLGAGYNVLQAQTAIGSGGWLGKGVGEGSQSRLRFLPEASTDFMFAVIGEELGFLGVSIVLVLFGGLIMRVIWIGSRSNDTFAAVYAVMIAGMFGLHMLINVGMNMGIMPVTGIPLPFASAAASSLVAGFIALGVLESIAIHARG